MRESLTEPLERHSLVASSTRFLVTSCSLYTMLLPRDHFVWRYHGSPAPQRRSWTMESTSEGLAFHYIYHIVPPRTQEDVGSHHTSRPTHLVDSNQRLQESTPEVMRQPPRRLDPPPSIPFARIPLKYSNPCQDLSWALPTYALSDSTGSWTSPDSSFASSPATLAPGTPVLNGRPNGSYDTASARSFHYCHRSRASDHIESDPDTHPEDEPTTLGRKRRRRPNELPRDFERRRHMCEQCGKRFAR